LSTELLSAQTSWTWTLKRELLTNDQAHKKTEGEETKIKKDLTLPDLKVNMEFLIIIMRFEQNKLDLFIKIKS
jgi:hypothetical protein